MNAGRNLKKGLIRPLVQYGSRSLYGRFPPSLLDSTLSKVPLLNEELGASSSWRRFLHRSTTATNGFGHFDFGALGRGSAYGRAFSSSSAGKSSSSLPSGAAKMIGNLLLVIGCGVATYYYFPRPQKPQDPHEEEHVVTNWSGTHEAKTKVYIQPESLQELEAAMSWANSRKQKLRPVGSGLSPNGIGLSDDGMVNLALMDEIVDIDMDRKRVTVQAGARVEQVVEALRPHGLTLQNFASIRQQQIGGFTQVGAHGTGAALPPVDEQVVSLKLVTPAKGTLDLSAEKDPELFYLARCSLGTLGVVAEVTLQCVPVQKLLEHTFVTTRKEVRKKHKKWLQENKHLRYMWVPDTDAVVVVKCNPLPEGKELPVFKSKYSNEDRLKHVRFFYKESAVKYRAAEQAISNDVGEDSTTPSSSTPGETDVERTETVKLLSDAELADLSFTELRDKLLAMDPLNREHVVRVNQVEAEYWKRCEGYRVGWSDEILGFDCGGQQWVSEVCFPAGSFKRPDGKDLSYMEKLLDLVKEKGIPAPAPIEQRWTAGSRSPLSPASNPSKDSLYSWVGIIMYLPTSDEEQRKAITDRFMEYRHAAQRQLWDAYAAFEHWAKIEVADNEETRGWLQDRLRKRFPVKAFNKARKDLDPNGILSNDAIDQIFPLTEEEST